MKSPILLILIIVCAYSCSKSDSSGAPPAQSDSTQTKEKILLDEQFDNNKNGWELHSTSNVDSFGLTISLGGYYLTTLGADRANVVKFPKNYFTDSAISQYIETGIWQTQGNPDTYYGLIFSVGNSNDRYSFVIASSGYFMLYSTKTGGVIDKTLIDWTHNDTIKAAPNTNVLKVVRQKDKFSFYINGLQVGQQTLSNIPLDTIGFQEGTFTDDRSCAVVVDYVKLWEDVVQ